MEYIMRLYLGLDNMTARSNETAKVEIYYLPDYDLIKLHKTMFIWLQQRAPPYLAFPPWACRRSVVLWRNSMKVWSRERGYLNEINLSVIYY